MRCSPPRGAGERTVVHDVRVGAALAVFEGLAHVSVFRPADTLSLLRDRDRARVLEPIDDALGIVSVATSHDQGVDALRRQLGLEAP